MRDDRVHHHPDREVRRRTAEHMQRFRATEQRRREQAKRRRKRARAGD